MLKMYDLTVGLSNTVTGKNYHKTKMYRLHGFDLYYITSLYHYGLLVTSVTASGMSEGIYHVN